MWADWTRRREGHAIALEQGEAARERCDFAVLASACCIVPMTAASTAQDQSLRFMLLYALAAAGGAAAYVPFLTILLPMRVTVLAGEAQLGWLAWLTFGGAVAASLSNILFGWLSDRTRNRRGWIVGGLIVSGSLLMGFMQAERLSTLLILLIAWQSGLNMMLAPLAAWAGDCVPDHQKGMLGGLLAFSPAAGALCGALVTLPGFADPSTRLAMVALLVCAMVLPAVLLGRPRPMPQLMLAGHAGPARPDPPRLTATHALTNRSIVRRMWGARLLVQIADTALFAFLYLWFLSIDPTMGDNRTARIFSVVLSAAIPLSMIVGRWSDTRDRPIQPLALAALGSMAGLLMMAQAPGLAQAIAGYAVFGLSAAVFLSLHSSQTLRVLPHPARRGRDLAVFNLTNTVPSLIMPWLTIALVPNFGFSALFLLLAGLLLAATLLLGTIPRLRRPLNAP